MPDSVPWAFIDFEGVMRRPTFRRPSRATLQLAALLTLFGLCLVLLVAYELRLAPADTGADASRAMHAQVRELDTTLLALRARRHAYTRSGDARAVQQFQASARASRAQMGNLRAAACGDDGTPVFAPEAVNAITRAIDAEEALMGAATAPPTADATGALAAPLPVADDEQWLQGMHGRVRALDAAIDACHQRQLDDGASFALVQRSRVLALTVALAALLLAILWLHRTVRRRLRYQVRFNEQLIDAIPLPLSLRSPDSIYMLVNRAWERKHGLKRTDVLGERMKHYFSQVTVAAIDALDAKAASTPEPVEQEFSLVARRERRDVQLRLQALRQRDDTLIGTILIETDVTALRMKEVELTGMNERLKQLSAQMMDAQEDERRRIARDLHDQVGQILTALKLQLASLGKRERIEVPATAMVMPIDLTEEALRHTRDLTASLHPHLLDDLGLEPALGWLIDRFIRPSVPDIELRCRLEPPRSAEAVELVAFRVVQESLTNVVRHARATRIGVMLATDAGQLAIEVIDDGVGFVPADGGYDVRRATSLGVTAMRDRVTEVGGEFHIDSHPGGGTSLRVRLPW
jgi:PAS domain S-box-containing protein